MPLLCDSLSRSHLALYLGLDFLFNSARRFTSCEIHSLDSPFRSGICTVAMRVFWPSPSSNWTLERSIVRNLTETVSPVVVVQ